MHKLSLILIQSHSFKSANIPQNSAFFEPYFCSQPIKCGFFYTSVSVIMYNVCSIHRGDTMSTLGDIMRTSGGYHEDIGGIS